MCFSSPSVPDYTVEEEPAAVQQASSAQKQERSTATDRAKEAAGLASTTATTPSGLTSTPTTTKKTLLGQ